MRKLAVALAAVSALAFSAPAFAGAGHEVGARPMHSHVKVVRTGRQATVKKVVVKRSRWHRHEGWRAHRAGVTRKVVVKKRPNGTTVVKKTITRR